MPRGRPRQFDPELVIDRALEIFWRDGYEGASVNDLADAMGLSKPSLYAAFGDKEALYIRALARYGEIRREQRARLLDDAPTGRTAIETLLHSVVDAILDPSLPGGCMVVSGTGTCDAPAIPDSVKRALSAALHVSESNIACRLSRAQQEGDLTSNAQVTDMAAFYNTVIAGLSIQAKMGADADVLRRVVVTAMAAWPTSD